MNKFDLKLLRRKPRHRWFSAPSRENEDGWFGPHKTIEAAVIECACNRESDDERIFVGQGYRLNARERDERGAEYNWEVDVKNAVEIILPKVKP
jgi:hypothetical protein